MTVNFCFDFWSEGWNFHNSDIHSSLGENLEEAVYILRDEEKSVISELKNMCSFSSL